MKSKSSGGDFCRRYANSLGEGTFFEASKELYGFAIKVAPTEKSCRLLPAAPTEKSRSNADAFALLREIKYVLDTIRKRYKNRYIL